VVAVVVQESPLHQVAEVGVEADIVNCLYCCHLSVQPKLSLLVQAGLEELVLVVMVLLVEIRLLGDG
jgi:hypothetical protein